MKVLLTFSFLGYQVSAVMSFVVTVVVSDLNDVVMNMESSNMEPRYGATKLDGSEFAFVFC